MSDSETMLLSEVRRLEEELRRTELFRWNWEQSARRRLSALRVLWTYYGGRFIREGERDDVDEIRSLLGEDA